MIESPTDPRTYYRGYYLVAEPTTIGIFDSHERIDEALTMDQAKRVVDGWVEREVR